jgi:sulfoxide reductase heme-binding subunit YedZ
MKDPRFAKLVLAVNAMIPLAIIASDWWNDRLGANPLEFFTNATGLLTLAFLALSLAVTPVRKLTGWNFLSHFRRMLGLYAFFYGFLHLLAFMWFNHAFKLRPIIQDVVRRPFITFGMLGFFLMIPLAATSTNAAIKRLGGKRWKMLHRLAYVSAIAGVVHYWLKVKVVTTLPMTFALIITVLLLYRVIEAVRPRPRARVPASVTT